MKRLFAILGLFSSLALLVCVRDCFSHTLPEPKPPLELRLSLRMNTFRIGEPIEIDVRLVNKGNEPLFVGSGMPEIADWIYSLHLDVSDSRGNRCAQSIMLPPFVRAPDADEGFTNSLVRRWLVLFPSYFYGTTTVLDMETVECLRKPGRYRIRAFYSSMGMDADLYYNPLASQPTEVAKLPFKSWKGTIESNPIWITVLGTRRRDLRPEVH